MVLPSFFSFLFIFRLVRILDLAFENASLITSPSSLTFILSADSFRDSLSFFLLSYAVADLVIDRFFRQVRVRRNIVNFHIFLSGFNWIPRDCVEELFRV